MHPAPTPTPPVATYRVQLRGDVTLDSLCDDRLLDDLSELGISDLYLSPILESAPGSTHGYDVVDPTHVDPSIGGHDALIRLADAAHAHGMGLVIDIVPNHMAAHPEANPWWRDVLANGPASQYATYFDIDWESPEPNVRGRILLPVLPDHIGKEIEAGAFRVRVDRSGISLEHASTSFPLEARSLVALLESAIRNATSDRDADWRAEVAEIADALDALAPYHDPDEARRARRRRELPAAFGRLEQVIDSDDRASAALQDAANEWIADPDRLDELLMRQPYRLARWRAGIQDLAYRRFFDVTDLIALRQDDEEVVRATHGCIAELVGEGVVRGLRVDHPDGLRDPGQYFGQLSDMAPGAWIVVEKILSGDEELPAWPVAGTTGYEVAELIGRLFLDETGRGALERAVTDVGGDADAASVIRSSTATVLDDVLAADLHRLAERLLRVCEEHRRIRDVTRFEATGALRQLIACFPVYRIYTDDHRQATPQETDVVERAVSEALATAPEVDAELVEFIGHLLTKPEPSAAEADFRQRFHQLSGPAKAKGQEDTACYRLMTSLHRTEVGSEPGAWALDLAEFHDAMVRRQAHWPSAMTLLSTHDSKRSEDVRARLAALSEMTDAWIAATDAWSARLARPDAVQCPDPLTQLYVFQTLVGAHPIDGGRLGDHLLKAVREAKRFTSWLQPDDEYEEHLALFVASIADDADLHRGVAELVEAVDRVARPVSASQKILHLTVPGVPDLYQHTEDWNVRLVDPDNRVPLDPEVLHRRLTDASPKVELTRRLLRMRREHPECFGASGEYRPIYAVGPKADHVVAFQRGADVVVACARRFAGLGQGWGDTRIELPEGRWRVAAVGTWDPGGVERPDAPELAAGPASLDELIGRSGGAVLERAR